MRQRKIIPGVDPRLLIKDAATADARRKPARIPARRRQWARSPSLPAATSSMAIPPRAFCERYHAFNDGAQAALFNRTKLAPEFSESAITRPFPFNAYYDEDEAPEVDGKAYKLEIAGLVDNKKPWTPTSCMRFPKYRRSRAMFAWKAGARSARGRERRLRIFSSSIGADTRAKYVWFKCAEGYTNTIDMPTALHPQTQMSFKFDHKVLPRAYGFPMKIRIPTKLGFKNPKYVVAMEVTNTDKGGYWENQGYNWFSGL